MGIERRKHPRHPADDSVQFCTVRVLYSAGGEQRLDAGRIKNVSAGGMFIETANPAPVDELILMSFHYRQREPLRMLGKVAWVDAHTRCDESGRG